MISVISKNILLLIKYKFSFVMFYCCVIIFSILVDLQFDIMTFNCDDLIVFIILYLLLQLLI
jgi:hypothetical protein